MILALLLFQVIATLAITAVVWRLYDRGQVDTSAHGSLRTDRRTRAHMRPNPGGQG